jgi:hypothetical protein
MSRVFVLGAGASAFAGYPVGPNLWRFLRDTDPAEALTRDAHAAVMALMEPILRLNPPAEHDRPDLEKLFTLLDICHLGVGPAELRRSDWPLTRLKVMRLIVEDFQWQEWQFQGQIIHARQPFGLEIDRTFALSVLAAWVDTLKPGDTIISFNWDLLHEAALWRAGKWHFADGYGFHCRDAPEAVHSQIKILKLHGSVNWAQESPLDVVAEIEHKKDFFEGAIDDPQTYRKRAGHWNLGRHLIVPSYMKDPSTNRLFLRLWNQARTALREADVVIVIGFSLNPADAAARELFATALDQRSPPPRLMIVSPEQPQWDMFCHYNLCIKQERIRERFEDWITSKPLSS